MAADIDFPAPTEGSVLTHFLVVTDQDRSRRGYERVLGGETILERDPVITKVANSWIILDVGGGPTEDKPDTTLETPPDPQPPAHSSTSESRTLHRSISSGQQPERSS